MYTFSELKEKLKMAKANVETLNQKLDDFIQYTKEKLDSIESKASFTNGKIATALMEINSVKIKQEDCPARQLHNTSNRIQIKGNFIAVVALIISLLSVLSAYW